MKIFIRYLASIFKRLSLNVSKQFSVIGQLICDVTLQAVEASRDLVGKSDVLLTLYFCISIVFGYLKIYAHCLKIYGWSGVVD